MLLRVRGQCTPAVVRLKVPLPVLGGWKRLKKPQFSGASVDSVISAKSLFMAVAV